MILIFDFNNNYDKIYTQYFSAKFVLTDKDGKTIFERIDKREDEKKAYDMFNRAVKDCLIEQ